MTALGKLLRTTTFKLTLVYLVVFALFAAFLLAYFALNTRRLITEQINDTVNAEITGLSEQYRLGGVRRLVEVIDARALGLDAAQIFLAASNDCGKYKPTETAAAVALFGRMAAHIWGDEWTADVDALTETKRYPAPVCL